MISRAKTTENPFISSETYSGREVDRGRDLETARGDSEAEDGDGNVTSRHCEVMKQELKESNEV